MAYREHHNNSHQSRRFKAIMTEATHTMPYYRRLLSRALHLKAIWWISNLLSNTLARPNAVLFGAIASFAATFAVYLLSKNFGYSLSGFESIGAFMTGWVVGIIFDLLSHFSKKK